MAKLAALERAKALVTIGTMIWHDSSLFLIRDYARGDPS